MPELPEVETAARDLNAQLAGARLKAVQRLTWPKIVEGGSPEAFTQALEGQTVHHVDRRAKWILIHLNGPLIWALHLRMSGAAIVKPAHSPADAHTHLVIQLEDGRELHWRDVRKFGRHRLLDAAGLAELNAAHGLEPLSDAFTVKAFAQLLHGRRTRIKAFLLDQSSVAGLGNIYVDEALWFSQIHPERSADSLSPAEVKALHANIVMVLSRAIEHGGSTFRDYRNGYGEVGGHQDHFRAYGQTGKGCARCGTPIVRLVLAQRGTHLCPTCQQAPAARS